MDYYPTDIKSAREDKLPLFQGACDRDNSIIFKEQNPWFQLFVKHLTETFFPNSGLWFSIEISGILKNEDLGTCDISRKPAKIKINFKQPGDEIDSAGVIVHEIIHAHAMCSHGTDFQIEAAQKGLIMIQRGGYTTPTRTFAQKVEAILKEIGKAPDGLFLWRYRQAPAFYCVRNQCGNWDVSRDLIMEKGEIMLLKNKTLETLNQWEKKYFKGLSPKKNRKEIPVLYILYKIPSERYHKQSLFMTLLKIFISRSSPTWNAYWTQFNEELNQQEKICSTTQG